MTTLSTISIPSQTTQKGRKGKGDSKIIRLPETGPLDIEHLTEFFESSKKAFFENWTKPLSHSETLKDFEQITLLSTGSFGSVILIRNKTSNRYHAMKAMEKAHIIKSKQLTNIKNEKMVLQCLNFPLTVYLLYCFKDNSYIYLVMPFISGGELFTHLRKVGKFTENQTRFLVSQMILALEYLHYLDFIYRDLKPENILMDETGYLKLTDFGFCKLLNKERTYTLCGTPEYLAPEVILNKGYGKSVDWWTIGVLTYELAAGRPPFYAETTIRTYKKITEGKYEMPNHFTPELKDLVKNILQRDTSRRFGNLKNGVNDIKDHKWFRTVNWLSVLNRRVEASYLPKLKKEEGDTSNFDKIVWKPLKISAIDKFPGEFADF